MTATLEGDAIYSYLYEQKSNARFIPILLDRKDEGHIPRPLKGVVRVQEDGPARLREQDSAAEK